jgi:hypothetical protein
MKVMIARIGNSYGKQEGEGAGEQANSESRIGLVLVCCVSSCLLHFIQLEKLPLTGNSPYGAIVKAIFTCQTIGSQGSPTPSISIELGFSHHKL